MVLDCTLNKTAETTRARVSVPEFCAGPACFGYFDESSKEGAEIMCRVLRQQWEIAGHTTAKFWPKKVASRGGKSIYGVRSNLVNGMPPGRAA